MIDTQDPNCIFCKIIQGKIPSRKVYEDDDMFAFHDINPSAPVHFLMIPKLHLENLYDADLSHQPLIGKLFALKLRLSPCHHVAVIVSIRIGP